MKRLVVEVIVVLCLILVANLSQIASAGAWTEQTKFIASALNSGDRFGCSASVDGDYAIFGAYGDDLGQSGGFFSGSYGSAYIFQKNDSSWVEMSKLTASDGDDLDYFGASVSISGDFAIVGAKNNDWGGSNSKNYGAAYVFQRSGSTWTEITKLTASDGAQGDYFGSAVSISGDYAIVTSTHNDEAGFCAGAAYIFKWDGSSWSEMDKFTASDASESVYFGNSASISGDYAIVGCANDDDNGSNSGSAYIFHREESGWTGMTKLLTSDGTNGDSFGTSVWTDGEYAMVGASGEDDNGTNSGSAYIYHREGTAWTQIAKLIADDGTSADAFGGSVVMNGEYAVISAVLGDGEEYQSGSAYVFRFDGTNWTQAAKLTASDGVNGDDFGNAVVISDGSILVGASAMDGSGAVYVYSPVPEPGSLCLLALGGLVFLIRRR